MYKQNAGIFKTSKQTLCFHIYLHHVTLSFWLAFGYILDISAIFHLASLVLSSGTICKYIAAVEKMASLFVMTALLLIASSMIHQSQQIQ